VHLIPNAPLDRHMAPVFVDITENADFAASVSRAGGSAHFSVTASAGSPAAIDILTSSPNRDDANRTLTVVDSVIRQRFLDEQVGTPPEDLMRLATVARHTA